MARFKIKMRTVALWGGMALIVLSVYPAWNRLQTHLTVQRARTSLLEGDLETALEILRGLRLALPNRPDICYLLGVANRRAGHFDESFWYLQKAENLGWPIADLTRQRYMARFQAGDLAGTRDYLEGLLIRGSNDEVATEIYEALAKGFLAEFRIDDAAVVLDHWIAWRPDAQALRWRAELFEQDEDWKHAAEHYRRLIAVSPGESTAYLHLGDTLLADLQVEEAKGVYSEARQRFPENVLACLGLAQCERRLGNSAEATRYLRQVLASDVQSGFKAHALSELGQIALESSDYDQAIQHFEASLEADPDSQTYHLLGTAYARLGKTAEANAQFARAKKILDIHRRLKQLIIDVAKHPSNLDERFEIGNLLLELGNDDKACRWFLTVIHIDPGHAGARTALGSYFSARGKPELAEAHRRAARQSQPESKTPNNPKK